MSTAGVRRTALVPVALLVLALTGCASGDDGAERDAGGGEALTSSDAGAAADEAAGEAAEQVGAMTEREVLDTARSIIATGTVSLRAEDVPAARRDVQAVVDRYQGEVQEAQTETDRDGEPVYARMVVRVPTADFDAAVAELEGVADLAGSDQSKEDVTTQVIDTEVRVRVERRTINRILALIDRATSISQIVALEQQLAQRQADLASLEQQQKHLADQTAMATITVSIERAGDADERDTDETGFLAGLDAGWDALRGSALVLATVAGALIPWLAVLALLGGPAWLVLRRRTAAARRYSDTGAPATNE